MKGWLERADAPETRTFRSEVLTVTDDVGFVRGRTRDGDPPTDFSTLWAVRLAPDGQCAEFTAWWMAHDCRGAGATCSFERPRARSVESPPFLQSLALAGSGKDSDSTP